MVGITYKKRTLFIMEPMIPRFIIELYAVYFNDNSMQKYTDVSFFLIKAKKLITLPFFLDLAVLKRIRCGIS
jgi:hypothetical protein